jgi:drug/metabolite transporter (DMT)-like permease
VLLLIPAGICLYYTALLLLPLADVVVFGFLTPLIVALLSPLLVKEHPSWFAPAAAALIHI